MALKALNCNGIKGHHREIKNGTPEWKITFLKQILDKGLVSTIYKELL